MIRSIPLILLSLLILSCDGYKKKERTVNGYCDNRNEAVNSSSFPLPLIPMLLTKYEDRKKYLIQHYWDKFNFADTVLVNNRELTEQGFVNNISLLADKTNAKELVKDGIDNFCSAMEKHQHARKVCMQMVDDNIRNFIIN